MDSSTLFEDVFEVKESNPDGKFFDKGLLFARHIACRTVTCVRSLC